MVKKTREETEMEHLIYERFMTLAFSQGRETPLRYIFSISFGDQETAIYTAKPLYNSD